MWVLSGVSGLSYKFELCAGKDGCVMQNGEPELGAASNVVKLCRHIHLVVNDNFLSRKPRLTYLAMNGIHNVATVHANCMPDYKPLPERKLKSVV